MTLMSELGSRAREILHSGRELDRPTGADRERVESALRERLGAALFAVDAAKSAPPARPRWPFVTRVVVGTGLLGGALFLASPRQPAIAHSPRVIAPALMTSRSASPLPLPSAIEVPSPEVSKSAAPAPSARPSAGPRRTEDRLAREVALLGEATSSLHGGRPTDALKALDEYQRRFREGLLTQEHRAARAQALCALGRETEGRAELAKLPPQSLVAARARQVCDARWVTKR